MVTDGGEREGGQKRMWLLKGGTRDPCDDEAVLSFNNIDDYTNLHM